MKGIPNDPKYAAAADQIAANEGSTGALAWCLQEDGSLTVVINPGPKINRPLPKAGRRPAAPANPVRMSEQEASKKSPVAISQKLAPKGPYDIEDRIIPPKKKGGK